MPQIAYVNGRFCELGEARVSVEDRGFQFADGVYEVVVAYGRQVFLLEGHFERLRRSLRAIDLAFDLKEHRIKEMMLEGIERAGFAESMVYLQITRGACARELAYPAELPPTVVATFKAKPVIDANKREHGLSVVTVPDDRWANCHIKSIALLPNALAKNRARRGGYDDAIFVSASGEVREATAANVFVIRGGVLGTPPIQEAILEGITRGFILKCAAGIELPVREAPLSLEDLTGADEVFISSTTVDVLGVTRVNDQPVGAGAVGPITRRLFQHFQRQVGELPGS